MLHRFLLVVCFLAAATLARSADAAASALSADAAFAKLKSLVGDWSGPVGSANSAQFATVQYRLTAGGSTVMETLFPGTPHEMVTMYRRNHGVLVLTHFCAMGNQPEMALAADSTADELRFTFTGGGNLTPGQGTYMHAGRIRFPAPDRIEAEWEVLQDGKSAGFNRFFLTRAVAPKS